jgi:spore germination cell wall hydrolase CwlJ-like protein
MTTQPKQAAQASGTMQISDIAARSQASVPPDIQLASLPAQDTVPDIVQDAQQGAAQETPAPSSSSIVATAVPLIPLKDVPLPRIAPPMSPADRLGLKGKDYSRAERCLANAIYFEARSEPIRGQMAVAQVVINRVFSGFYPNDVCGVVYQNANRHLSCQFTFACDGKSKAITERSHWAVANRIARQTLDGQIYVPEVGKSTHYHAAYVHPNWAHEMRRLVRFGLHSFYRPYAWGNGSEEPVWGPSPSLAHGHKTASR